MIRDPEHWALALPETHACNESPESSNGAGQGSSLQHQRPTIQPTKHQKLAAKGHHLDEEASMRLFKPEWLAADPSQPLLRTEISPFAKFGRLITLTPYTQYCTPSLRQVPDNSKS